MRNPACLLVALSFLAAPPVHAAVYKCVDAAGKVTYQEVACPPAAKGESLRTPSPQVQPTAEAPSAAPAAAAPAKAAPAEDPIAQLRSDCVESVMRDGRATWERVAFGDPRAGAFPQQEFQASAEGFCACVAGRVKESVPPAEIGAKGMAAFASFGTEALQGGQCQPTGAWARLMARQF